LHLLAGMPRTSSSLALVKAPDGLTMTLIATLDASRDEEAALDATSAAIETRPGITVDSWVQRERGEQGVERGKDELESFLGALDD
jgi:hypothetical protein